jgi:hypothetical protein
MRLAAQNWGAGAKLRGVSRLKLYCLMEIPIGLQTHPQLRGSLQEAPQPESSICCDGALAEHYLVEAVE